MENILLDADVIIRFLTNDDEIQSPLAYNVFEKAVHGDFTLVISPLILAECVWVLQMKRYGYSKKNIANRFTQLILSPGIKSLEEEITLKTLQDFSQHNVDFIDAYLSNASLLDNKYPIVTWSKKDFNRLGCEFYTPESLVL